MKDLNCKVFFCIFIYKNIITMANQTTTYSGISLTTVLFIVFLILKLTHVIDWSWWWVTSPLWIPAALGLSIIAMFAIVTGIIILIDGD